MRILLVEDKIDFARTIEKAVRAIDGCELTWKRSMAGALEALVEESFDVVILDRRIPTEDDVLDDHEDHGWAVFQWLLEHHPGTSVWFLTATIDADFATSVLNAHSRRGDIHRCGREDSVYQVFWKDKMTACIAAVRAFRADVAVTDALHVRQVGQNVNLQAEEVRLLKLFCRGHKGASVEAQALTGGLSEARVFRISVLDAAGAEVITSVAKIGTFSDIAIEREKYKSEVIKLAPGSFPQVTGEIGLGAAHFSGIFYGVVGAKVRNLFDELVIDPDQSATVPGRLRADQAAWLGAGQNERLRVSSIRRILIGDVALESLAEELEGIDLAAVEAIEINVTRCIQHGDLHCANVLFDGGGRPMLIDYPDIGRAPASLDPIALELSTIFHKDAPPRDGWPSQAQAEGWTDIDIFSAGASIEKYLRACRDWATGVAASEQEVWAVGYSYALRQLKYDDTDKAVARAIIITCINRLIGAVALA